MKKEMIKETARDLIALGSIPFFLLVLVRIWILDNPPFLAQFVFAGIIFLAIHFFIKINIYAGLSIIVLVFTILNYSDLRFTIFGSAIYLLLIGSLIYLKNSKEEVLKGFVFGALSSWVSAYLVRIYFG